MVTVESSFIGVRESVLALLAVVAPIVHATLPGRGVGYGQSQVAVRADFNPAVVLSQTRVQVRNSSRHLKQIQEPCPKVMQNIYNPLWRKHA